MNRKHLACILVGLLIVCIVQGTMWMKNRMAFVQSEAQKATTTANLTATQLLREKKSLSELSQSSEKLIDFLRIWEPYFSPDESPQSAELNITLKIKEDNLVSLSQRYEVVALKGNQSLPYIGRSHITLEDNYARLLNWLGRIETSIPTVRLSSLRVAKGTGKDDLRMEIIFEQPLMKRQ